MSTVQKPSKEQLLKAIEQLEKNPDNKLKILGDVGIGVVGAAAAGGAVATFGTTTLLFGLVTVAPPVGLVVGGAALGAAALVGAKNILLKDTFNEGKKAELLRHLKDQLREVEAKERSKNLGETDKNNFISSLKEPIRLNLIDPEDALDLIQAVQNGKLPIKDAIKVVEDIVKAAKV